MEVIQDKINPHLYRIKYDDGTISDEMWNKSWAGEQIRRIEEFEKARKAMKDSDILEIPPSPDFKMPRKATEMAAGALKSKKGMEVAKT